MAKPSHPEGAKRPKYFDEIGYNLRLLFLPILFFGFFLLFFR